MGVETRIFTEEVFAVQLYDPHRHVVYKHNNTTQYILALQRTRMLIAIAGEYLIY